MLIKFEVNMELSFICLLCLLAERLEQVLDVIRHKCRLAKDTHDFKERPANLEVMLDDGNEAICDDGNVNLYSKLSILTSRHKNNLLGRLSSTSEAAKPSDLSYNVRRSAMP